MALVSFDNSSNSSLSIQYIDDGFFFGDNNLIPSLDRPMPTNTPYHSNMGILPSISYSAVRSLWPHQIETGSFGDYDGDGLLDFIIKNEFEYVLVGVANQISNSRNLNGFVVKDYFQVGCTDGDSAFQGKKICHASLAGSWIKTPKDQHLMSLKNRTNTKDYMVVLKDSACGSIDDPGLPSWCPAIQNKF